MEDHVSRLLNKIAISHRTASEEAFSSIGLHKGQASLLFELWAEDGQSQADLTRTLGVAAPTVNVLVSKLCAGGYVTVADCPKDGRLKRVYLTGKGRNVENEAARMAEELDRRLLEGFSDLERTAAVLILNRMLENLSTTRPSRSS